MSAFPRPRRLTAVKVVSSLAPVRPVLIPKYSKPESVPRPIIQPRPPTAHSQPTFIRKHSDSSRLLPPEKPAGPLPRLPQLQHKQRQCSPSPAFAECAKTPLIIEDICLPYELEDPGKPRFIKKGNCEHREVSSKCVNISILSEFESAGMDLPSTNASFVEKPSDSRSVSPKGISRKRRLQQLSRHYVLSKQDLEKGVGSGGGSEAGKFGLGKEHREKTEKLPQDQMPQILFLSDLEDVLQVPAPPRHPPKSALLIKPYRRL